MTDNKPEGTMAIEQLHDEFDRWCDTEPVDDIDGHVITTPFFRYDGDAIRIWVSQLENGKYALTDAGQTYARLYLADVDTDSEWYKKLTDSLMHRYDLDSSHYTIELTTEEDRLGKRLIEITQAVNTLSDVVMVYREVTHYGG